MGSLGTAGVKVSIERAPTPTKPPLALAAAVGACAAVGVREGRAGVGVVLGVPVGGEDCEAVRVPPPPEAVAGAEAVEDRVPLSPEGVGVVEAVKRPVEGALAVPCALSVGASQPVALGEAVAGKVGREEAEGEGEEEGRGPEALGVKVPAEKMLGVPPRVDAEEAEAEGVRLG